MPNVRMNGYSDDSKQVAIYYDALGRRVAKTFSGSVGSFTQSFVHLGLEDRILQAKAGDATITTFIDGHGVDEHLAEVKNGVGKGYVTDHLGSVLNGDPAGASHSFGLFGEVSADVSVSSSSSPVMYGFTGREYDAESGLSYHRARYYNPNIGRFLSQEPSGIDGPNLYTYAYNNPLLYVDPDGLEAMPANMTREEFEAKKAEEEGDRTTERGVETDWAGLAAMTVAAYGAVVTCPPAVVAATNNRYVRIGEGKFPEPFSKRMSIGSQKGNKFEIGRGPTGRIDVKIGNQKYNIWRRGK